MMSRNNIFKKTTWDMMKSAMLPILFSAIIIGTISYGLSQTEESSGAEGLIILEDSIRRAVVTAYAIEGRYPDSLQYIEDNFGVHIDQNRYIVHYRVFATNLMPDIMVFEK